MKDFDDVHPDDGRPAAHLRDQMRRTGMQAFRAGDFAGARAAIEPLVRAGADAYPLRRALALSYLKLGDPVAAQVELDAARTTLAHDMQELGALEQKVSADAVRAAVARRCTTGLRQVLRRTDPDGEAPYQRAMRAALDAPGTLDELCPALPRRQLASAVERLCRVAPTQARVLCDAARRAYRDCDVLRRAEATLDLADSDDPLRLAAAARTILAAGRDAHRLTGALRVLEVERRRPIPGAPTALGHLAATLRDLDRSGGSVRERRSGARLAMRMKDPGRAMRLLGPSEAGPGPDPEMRADFDAAAGVLAPLGADLDDAVDRFWSEVAMARDPVAAARRAFAPDAVNVTVPMGWPGADGANDDHLICLRAIAAARDALRGAGRAVRLHLWPWAPIERPPRMGRVPVFAYHSRARLGDRGTLVHKGSHLPGLYTIDPAGFSGWSALRGLGADAIRAMSEADAARRADDLAALRDRFVGGRLTKHAQRDAMPLPEAGFVLLALQLRRDSVQMLARIDQLTLLRTVAAWAARTGARVVVKRHPKCTDAAIEAELQRLPPSVTVSTCAIHDLLARARTVVVGNSGVGFEALLHGRRVITAAASDYEVATHPVRSPAELGAALDAAGPPNDPDLIEQFVHVYTTRLMVDTQRAGALEGRIEAHFRLRGWL